MCNYKKYLETDGAWLRFPIEGQPEREGIQGCFGNLEILCHFPFFLRVILDSDSDSDSWADINHKQCKSSTYLWLLNLCMVLSKYIIFSV